MKKNKLLAVLFGAASLLFFAGTVNHILNTGEGIASSLFLALGCMCIAVACYRMK